MGTVATKGDVASLEALMRRMEEDKDSDVRRFAMQALGRVAARGDADVIAALTRSMEDDEDMYVRLCAVKAVGTVATKGNDVSRGSDEEDGGGLGASHISSTRA